MQKKPLLRGHFHQAAFFMALGSCVLLLIKTQDSLSLVAASVYSFSLINLLGTSALYHRINWNPDKRKWMKRLDHAAIYLLIAGTFTPICLLALSQTSGKNLLITIWSVAIVGIFQSLFYVQAPKWLSAIFYLTAGYLILPYLPELRSSIGIGNIYLIIIGGILYTIGAATYALKRPHLRPEIIGYHEVFHLLVVAAAACHFSVIYQLI